MKFTKEVAIGLLHSAFTESPDYWDLEAGDIKETDLISIELTPNQIQAIIDLIDSLDGSKS